MSTSNIEYGMSKWSHLLACAAEAGLLRYSVFSTGYVQSAIFFNITAPKPGSDIEVGSGVQSPPTRHR